MSDEVLFDDGGVTVTPARLASPRGSISVGSVTDAHVALHQRPDTSSIARAARGMLGFSALYLITRFGFAPAGRPASVGTETWLALGVIAIAAATLVWARPRVPSFAVQVVTQDGERELTQTSDRERAETIVQAIRKAITRHPRD